jgi:hypothetical protein
MATRIPHEEFALYIFDEKLKYIHLRIDTDDEYKIILVPPSTDTESLPAHAFIIGGPPSLQKTVQIGCIKPGEWVKITKVT